MLWFSAAVSASVVGIKCPRCRRVEARARPRGSSSFMRCRACGQTFSRAQGEALYREWRASASRARR